MLTRALMLGCSILLIFSAVAAEAPRPLEEIIADTVAKRQMNETRALIIDPNLDERDVRLLTDQELDLSPPALYATDKPFPRQPSASFRNKLADERSTGFKYQYWAKPNQFMVRGAPRDLVVDPALAPPK